MISFPNPASWNATAAWAKTGRIFTSTYYYILQLIRADHAHHFQWYRTIYSAYSS